MKTSEREVGDILFVEMLGEITIVQISRFVDQLDLTKPLWCHPLTPSGDCWSTQEVLIEPGCIRGSVGEVLDEDEEEEEISPEEALLRVTCLRIKATPCKHCLFGRNALVSPERVEAAIQANRKRNTIFSCHEASWQRQKICCHAFWKRFENELADFLEIKALAQRDPSVIRFVEPGGDRPPGLVPYREQTRAVQEFQASADEPSSNI